MVRPLRRQPATLAYDARLVHSSARRHLLVYFTIALYRV